MTDLDDRVAIVTGGASGIGEALVTALADRGASVLAVDLDGDGLDRIREATGCQTMVADVSGRAMNRAITARAVSHFGRLDLSFLNAGILDRRRDEMGDPFGVTDLDWDRYATVRGVLLDAVMYGTTCAVEAMDEGGAVMVTASAAGLVPWHPTPIYSSMKHAVVGWVRAIAPALERDGVRINAICPGGIATPLVGMSASDAEHIDRLLSPSQVADAMIEIATGGSTGDAWSIVALRDPVLQLHDFTPIPGFP